jgi:putative addiction module CopG family antidote
MNVNLGTVFDNFIAELLETGTYQTQSEVVREGLRLLKEREELKQLRLGNCERKSPSAVDRPTAASLWTVRRRLRESAGAAPAGSAARDEAVHSHTSRQAGHQRHLGLHR